MTFPLLRKLLRDARIGLLVTALLLAAFQCLWAKITSRILGELSPYFTQLAAFAGQNLGDIQDKVFGGPGKIIRTIIGGERVDLDRAMDLLSIGYVHPLVQTIFCVWAVGRASGAVAGEMDRGTMELLMAQPVSRPRLVLAHFGVDLATIPLLCLSLWAGTCLGTWLVGPIQPEKVDLGRQPGVLLLRFVPPETPEAQAAQAARRPGGVRPVAVGGGRTAVRHQRLHDGAVGVRPFALARAGRWRCS